MTLQSNKLFFFSFSNILLSNGILFGPYAVHKTPNYKKSPNQLEQRKAAKCVGLENSVIPGTREHIQQLPGSLISDGL